MNIPQIIEQLDIAISEINLATELTEELTEQLQNGKKLYEEGMLMDCDMILETVARRVNAALSKNNNQYL